MPHCGEHSPILAVRLDMVGIVFDMLPEIGWGCPQGANGLTTIRKVARRVLELATCIGRGEKGSGGQEGHHPAGGHASSPDPQDGREWGQVKGSAGIWKIWQDLGG